MHKTSWLVRILAGTLIVSGFVFFGLQLAVSLGTDVILDRFEGRMRTAGIQADLEVGRARFSPPFSIIWTRGVGNAALDPAGPLGSRLAGGTFSVEKTQIRPLNLGFKQWRVELTNAIITADPRAAQNPDPSKPASRPGPQTLFFKKIGVHFKLRVLDPVRMKQDILVLVEGLEDFVGSGKTPIEIEFEGKFLTSIGGQKGELHFKSVRKDGFTSLQLDRNELKKIGDLTEEGLTDAEVEVLMNHPAKAPRLLDIQRYASEKARKLGKTTRGFPSDAYRHVLWNYLLTKEYGSEFTLLLTNAHEAGENKTADDPRDHAMDLNNNRVGIGYALMGLDESEIQWKVVSDPRIIRSREEVRIEASAI